MKKEILLLTWLILGAISLADFNNINIEWIWLSAFIRGIWLTLTWVIFKK